jgi:hypothetical protein
MSDRLVPEGGGITISTLAGLLLQIVVILLVVALSGCAMNAGNIYVRAEAQQVVERPTFEGRWCETRWCEGPLGDIRVGINTDLTREIEIDLGIGHSSYVGTTSDRGVEYVFTNLTWRPFK